MTMVSIIIPIYNRAHLVGETLDSILNQTYENWECILVDDGSTDNTEEVIGEYVEKDARFKYYKRPEERPKGANACRNYGFELSKGTYINWFDSDDIMLKNFISCKLKAIEETSFDFVFSKTVNFDNTGHEFEISENDNKNKAITANNYILGLVTWYTPDFFAKKKCLEGIIFNELLNSGQEYNFFVKVLLHTNRGLFLDNILTRRRIHDNSIQQQLLKSVSKRKKERLFNEFVLLNDIEGKVPKEIIRRCFKRLISLSYETQKKFTLRKVQFTVLKELIKFGDLKVICCYTMWIITNFIIGKGYFWIKQAQHVLNDEW
ncbi:glycosyltransferase family 2 protein [Gaetbulibacter aquiaggeris]|uniref:Glycosyltransferase family 2 protein n=1 Tax=Gaetbulibacter aquiaggeris TaxID=1735373 RepID=A0ABW7MV31_9FLAO